MCFLAVCRVVPIDALHQRDDPLGVVAQNGTVAPEQVFFFFGVQFRGQFVLQGPQFRH